jgi:hypothetical protein
VIGHPQSTKDVAQGNGDIRGRQAVETLHTEGAIDPPHLICTKFALRPPVTDELLKAYVARQRNDNFIPNDRVLATYLGAPLVSRFATRANATCLLQALASALGLDLSTLVRDHTLIPIFALRSADDRAKTGFGHPRFLGRILSTLAGPAHFCIDCVKEDLQLLGYSSWRRQHHLPGVTWCVRHLRPLHEARRAESFEMAPSEASADSVERSPQMVTLALSSPVVIRYAEVLHALLQSLSHPAKLLKLSSLVNNRAATGRLSLYPRLEQKRSLGYEARKRIPRTWLSEHFPAIVSTRSAAADWTDRTGYLRWGANALQNFALAVALLWEDAAEANKTIAATKRASG